MGLDRVRGDAEPVGDRARGQPGETAQGFIRWYSFADGPHGYGIGLWRTPEDAVAFVRGSAHRAAVAEQHQSPFEYSQFAGIWSAHTIGRRTMHCPACGGRAVAPAQTCGGCGRLLETGSPPDGRIPSCRRAGLDNFSRGLR